jgi:hypothetical protein
MIEYHYEGEAWRWVLVDDDDRPLQQGHAMSVEQAIEDAHEALTVQRWKGTMQAVLRSMGG